jgi:hypothetical protein
MFDAQMHPALPTQATLRAIIASVASSGVIDIG